MSGDVELRLDSAAFLAEYWQRKPLLIRSAIDGFKPPVDSDQLAGLALEEDVESRLVEQRGDTWQLHHGPFEPADFQRDQPWTLLVQAVDHYIPEVTELHRLVDFIPGWRRDDIMVSYASDGGSVGPHYDNYDVFLLQGEGHRRWQLGQRCDESSPLLEHDELRILKSFEPSEEYVLGPGDILYVPPGVAHWGIAQGECTTFSIGFRAPRISDMVSRWADQLLQQMAPGQFFQDAGRAPAARPGEIQATDLEQVRNQLRAALDSAMSSRWFGELVTEPRYDITLDEDELAGARMLLRVGAAAVALLPGAKLAWYTDTAGLCVFANGESLQCRASVLPSLLLLCDGQQLTAASLDNALTDPDTVLLLDRLLQSGCIDVQ
jgi:50S ribosomal protein L16 3-hydroxylase